ncbi:uncharacterized protein LOC117109240 [Anneissia japonica]|uniref:uncharacterized protein LOC117109240 n=1 Tax=Anneissia japonica TaxID=1529436 RepID=UPI0014255343|nr:uncharacterized protein LOC117109240 [Anneissia japonica]
MTSMEGLQDQLSRFSFHFAWKLESKCIKRFDSLMNLIDEHIDESPAMVIEGLLFKSYLFYSRFNVEKEKSNAIDCLNKVRTLLQDDPREESLKDGYLFIVMALEAWMEQNKTKRKKKICILEELNSKYVVDSPNHKMFLGSKHATKGFALSRLGMIRYSESIEQFKTAVDLCPDENDWHFSLGLLIWRKGKASVRPNELCPDITKAQDIFYKVLKNDRNHSYAMVLIAEIKRRKGNNEKAEYFLKNALRPQPSRKKILGEVAQVYRRMKKYSEALKVLQKAERPGSFIYHQLYVVFRDQNIPPPEEYLQMAIDANPSNLAAKFDMTKEFISKKEYAKAEEYFEYILVNNEDDADIVIQTNYQFALFLMSINKLDDAAEKQEVLVDKALKECKENDQPPYTFFTEVDRMVRNSIKWLKNYYERKAERDDKDSLLKLAGLHKNLGIFNKTCYYYKLVLNQQPPINAVVRWTILEDVFKIKIEKELIIDTNSVIQDMEQLSLENPNPDILHKCKAKLAFKKGKIALNESRENDAFNLFTESVKFGSLRGARLLLDGLKNMDRCNRDFYTSCAQIFVCIENTDDDDDDKEQLKEDLDELLSADNSDAGVVLCDLRKIQVELERCCILQDKKQIAILKVDVIHKCRTILNQTMTKFRDCHYNGTKKSCDYFNIFDCSSAKIEEKFRCKIQEEYKWTRFQRNFRRLFTFLVSIQPASNFLINNWMFALIRMDNANKHENPLEEKLSVKVYVDKFGKMEEKEFTTLEVARKACDNIGQIVNEFYKDL